MGNFINMPRIHMISGFHREVNDNAACTKNLTKEHQPRNLHVLNMTGQLLPGGEAMDRRKGIFSRKIK
jgi:hypothetical protein